MRYLHASDAIDVPFGAYEKHVLNCYAARLLSPAPGKFDQYIWPSMLEWYRENRELLEFRVQPVEHMLRGATSHDLYDRFNNRLEFTPETMPKYDAVAPTASAFQKRLDWISRTLALKPAEATFLGAVARLTLVRCFVDLCSAAVSGRKDEDEVAASDVARAAGLSKREGERLGSGQSILFQLGLMQGRREQLSLSATVVGILSCRTTDTNQLAASLFGEGNRPDLTLSDFSHLESVRDQFLMLVDGALRHKEAGASFLFYGPPGTGKTEFARLVGSELNARVVFIGETGSDDSNQVLAREPTRADRLSHLALTSAVARRAGRVVLVIDEADDVFTGVDDERWSNRTGSKVFMNRIVEACPVPMIWITNHPRRLGPAVLRRMLMAVEFRETNRQTRVRIIERHAKAKGVSIPPNDVARLASLSASPALLEAGVRAASLIDSKTDAAGNFAINVTRSLLRVSGRDRPAASNAEPLAFDAALSNADHDLIEIEQQVAVAGIGALSFLFSGLPGTGKSAFARHLATRLGMEVLEKRGSDLLGMYVGETERRIADAFAEAADTRSFLIFDEADSLLGDRMGAQRSWEISQVNEMLTWIEHHPLPFAATTNLASRLDPATQRRFLFKVVFAAMTPQQAREAFRRAFAAEAPSSVARLTPLTPGDFSVVARRAAVLGIDNEMTLARLLEAEVVAKPAGAGTRIGF